MKDKIEQKLKDNVLKILDKSELTKDDVEVLNYYLCYIETKNIKKIFDEVEDVQFI